MGRDAELTTISQRLAAAANGHAGVVWIEADAGFGKTALVRRILGTLPDGFVVISAEADELAREQPFGVALNSVPPAPPTHWGSGSSC